MAPLRCAAKFDPLLSLDCARMEGRGRNKILPSGNLVGKAPYAAAVLEAIHRGVREGESATYKRRAAGDATEHFSLGSSSAGRRGRPTTMLSWGTNVTVLIAACFAAAVLWGAPSAEALLEDRILDYLRNGYSRSQRTTDDMFLRWGREVAQCLRIVFLS